MSALWKAMLEAQKEIKHAVKDAKNPHFKNDYATLQSTLDAVKGHLNRAGLVLSQTINKEDPGYVGVTTKIVHAESGETTEDDQVIPLSKNDAQGLGSAVTYARRYGIQAILAIASEDDDGEASVQRPPAPRPAPAAAHSTVEGVVVKKETMATSQQVADVTAKLGAALGFKPK